MTVYKPTITSLSKPPSEEAVNLIRSAAKLTNPDEPALAEWHDQYVMHHSERLAHDIDLVKERMGANAAILECGSAPYLLTIALHQLPYNIIGSDLEPNRYSDSIEMNKLNIMACDLERDSIHLDSQSLDLVLLNEVFEHLRINPVHTLTSIRDTLKPNGMLMMSTPNLKSLGGIRRFLFESKAYSCCAEIYDEYKKLDTIGHMGHVREYTTVEVTEFLEKVGFKVKELVFRGTYPHLISRIALRLRPTLRPFVSYVAIKA